MIDQNIFLQNLFNFESLNFSYEVKNTDVVQQYTIRYASNLEEMVLGPHRIQYTSEFLSEFNSRYTIYYDSFYGDVVKTYRIRYHSGRSLSDVLDRYYLRYTSLYTSETIKTYNVRYNTTGNSVANHRTRYRIKYHSNSALEAVATYKIRYTSSTFYDNTSKYTIRYTTSGVESLLVDAVLLRNNETTDALFQIRSLKDEILDPYLFVLANMPKYQLVEFRVGESLPYLQYLSADSVDADSMFDLDGSSSYSVKGYILLKDVEDLNGISLDIYDVEDNYRKVNKAKTYFFGVSPDDYQDALLSVNRTSYYFLNKTGNSYTVNNLNYVATAVTPTFRFGLDCCFSRKINKTNYSYCSPF